MPGMMQPVPLSITHIFHRAEQQFGEKRIFSAEHGVVREITVAQWAERVRRLATVLDQLGVAPDAAVATFAWNTQRHLELYYAVPCTGRVLHPLNIRVAPEHLRHILELVQDEIVFVDRSLLSTLWPLADDLPSVRHWVVMDDGGDAAVPDDPRVHDYEALLKAAEPARGPFEVADENQAAGICFTSGTTGLPKGVVYSHRATVLHAVMAMAAGLIGISERDRVLPIVPMFHAAAWGLPYSAMFAGADLVLPGPDLDPSALLRLMADLHVTVASAVPTIWAGMLPLVGEYELASLRAVFGGGSATPARLAGEWLERVGIPITHTWGMTELSPTGAVGGLRSFHDDESPEQREAAFTAQGTAVPFVDLRIVDVETGELVAQDGTSVGELQARGPTVASGYFGDEAGSALTPDGWLSTGDVASIDDRGYVVIRDRLKDLIKSGGEWIPSLELETAILSDPGVAEVAVVGRAHPKWAERPVAFVVASGSGAGDAAALLDRLRPRVPKWWLPDEVFFVDTLPRTGTGKIAKPELRARL